MTTTKRLLHDIATALQLQPAKIRDVHDALNRIPQIIRRDTERASRQREQVLAAADRQANILRQMAASIEKARQTHPLRWGG